jgi:DNA-binding PadR family transcriptional regulator
MVRRKISNPLALAVLALLVEKPMHPYEMSSTLRQRRKETSIKLNYGSLYSVVESLQRHGLIEATETIRHGRRPERTVYAITETGRREFVDWLSELLRSPVKEYTQFEAGLCDLLNERIGLLAAEQHTGRSMLDLAAKAKLPRLFWLEAEYWLMLREAELRYVTELVRQIRDGTLDGIDLWRRYFETGQLPTETDLEERGSS